MFFLPFEGIHYGFNHGTSYSLSLSLLSYPLNRSAEGEAAVSYASLFAPILLPGA